MLMIKKNTFLFLLCLAFLMTLSGCHGSKGLSEFSIPEQIDSSKKITISFWAKNDTNKTQTEIYRKAIEDFETLYPNITVNLKLYTKYGDIYNDVITNIATGTTPNVCISYPDHIATYLTGKNVVVPLDELVDDERYGLSGTELLFDAPEKDEIVSQFLKECRIGGTLYALPFMRSTEACYVNKTFVEKLGYSLPEILTWDFVFKVSEAAMEKDAEGNFLVNGQKVLIPFIYKSTDNFMIQMLRQKQAEYSNENGQILLFHDITKELLKELSVYGKDRSFSTFQISGYPANFLNAGQCIFAVDSTAGATWMGSDAPLSDISEDKLVRFETEVFPVPQFDPSKPQMISQGPSVCIFNKRDNEEVLASWLFAQFLLTDEVQNAYAKTEGYVPVTTKAQNSAAYQEYLSRSGEDNQLYYEVKEKAAKLMLTHVADTFVTPVFNGSASLRDAAGQLIENTVKSVRRGETVDDAYLDRLFEDMKKLYRLTENPAGATEKQNFGPLPAAAVALLVSLFVVWFLILFYLFCQWRKRKRKDF